MMIPRIGVINVSNRPGAGVYEDRPGQLAIALVLE
jgi:hypothetical protein